MSATLLIIDDDPIGRGLLEAMAHRFGFNVVVADSGEAGLARLAAPGHDGIDLVLLDLVMPDLDGFAVLERIGRDRIDIPVIVQTASGAIDTAMSALRVGAADFVVKPVAAERFQVSVKNALKTAALETELRRLSRRGSATLGFDDLPARSDAMETAVRLGRRAAASMIPVLLEGEPGVGKEVFARVIATSGGRARKPFVAVRCAAIPADQIDGVLFGQEKGVRADSGERQPGKFAEAHGGTLFLDDVGSLPAEAQAKLLQALQDGRIEHSGGRRPVAVDVRVICATDAGLIDLVKQGAFREDLYYRLGVFPIGLPPLRSRRPDIAPLARGFLARFAAEERRAIGAIAPGAMALLQDHPWPGNVRQLEGAICRAVALAEHDELTVADFPQLFAAGVVDSIVPSASRPVTNDAKPGPLEPGRGIRLTHPDGHVRTLDDVERDTIANALALYGGQMTEVARRLGIGRSTLYRKLKDLDLDAATCGTLDTKSTEAAA